LRRNIQPADNSTDSSAKRKLTCPRQKLNLAATFCDYADVSHTDPAGNDAETILCELLVLRCRRGDPEGWRQLVGHWERRLLYYLRRLLADERDAWDALQQTWMEVFRNLRILKNPGALRPWLYQIAHRRAISLRRSAPRDQVAEDDPIDADQIAAESSDDDFSPETADQIHHAIDLLSLPHRQVITLFFLEEMPIDEISQVLGVPPGTVKSRLHYAKLALRRLLANVEMP
jgi:RNA polymerase sigma-70 factor (ECF subfamily)